MSDQPAPSPIPHQRAIWRGWFHVLIAAATVVLAIAVRVLQLDRLPGELYGDIAIVYEYVDEIRQGLWPTHFVLSAGPLYHYTIAPFLAMTGMTYLGIKLASVIVSLFALLALYGLARQLHSVELGVLAAFVGAVGSWLLIFSRLGNSQILIPLLATSALLLLVRVARYGRQADVAGCAFVCALGLYTYPQTFILPPVIFITMGCLWLTGTKMRLSHLGMFIVWTIPFAMPFGLIVAQDPANFFTGYIGGKLEAKANPLTTFALNFWHAMAAFNIRGDSVFRSNPPFQPHLDAISGVLWLVGIVYWLGRGRRRMSPAIFVPFVLLQLPSMLVLSFPDEVPSASRTIAVAPLVYLLVASGLWWIAALVRRAAGRWPRSASVVTGVLVLVTLAGLATLNLERYWGPYARALPDDNTPFGRVIARYIDDLPQDTSVLVVGCCWGSASQPEPKGIVFSLRKPHDVRFMDGDKVTCDTIRELPASSAVIWGPNFTLPAPKLAPCARLFVPELHIANDKKVFYVSRITATQ